MFWLKILLIISSFSSSYSVCFIFYVGILFSPSSLMWQNRIRIWYLQRSLGHLGLVDVDESTGHPGSSPLLLHPYASPSSAGPSSSSSANHGHHPTTSALSPSANHHLLLQQQQLLTPQQQRPQSYHRSVSSSPPGEAEGGGPVPVIEFPDDEVLHCSIATISFSALVFLWLWCLAFGFWLRMCTRLPSFIPSLKIIIKPQPGSD